MTAPIDLPPVSEHAFQTGIFRQLTLQLPGCVVAAVPNERNERSKAAAKETAAKKRRGLCTGFPDLIVLWRGGMWLVEVKTPKTYLSPVQKEVHSRLKANGHDVSVVRTYREVDELVARIRSER